MELREKAGGSIQLAKVFEGGAFWRLLLFPGGQP